MIKTRIRPDTWDPAQGTSIEEKGGKLVVMQRPEVHKLIDQLLSNFRSTQKMMINIESRFLNIREAYLEQTGVEFQGLDPNVLFGDFGDLRRLGAPTGYIQPRVPGSGDTSPGNLPFPGFVNGPDRINGGTFSEVGTIINHFINFFPNEPESISAQDATNTVRQGGLSAQVTILNNAQVQAFIRALAVRENSSTLVAPRLTVFNTQRANMFVARQQSYVADYEISGDSYDPVIRQFLVGVVLDVRPIVSSDRRYVTLELRPTVTELVNFVTRQIDTFTVNSGAQVNVLVLLSFPIQFPELSIRRVRTTATVPDGGIMLVGGLYKNLKFNAENGVPFLSDLPVVGRLFRWNTVDNVKTNLAILVSPRIILFNEEEEKLMENPAPGPAFMYERKIEEKVKCK
jgi:type II secretory pathway component GspD/PulD (secretin)